MSRIILCVLVGMMAIGCGDDDGGTDSGRPAVDAGVTADSSTAVDTGPAVDSGPVADSGPSTDSGPTADSGPALACAAQACHVVSGAGCMEGEGCFWARLAEGDVDAAMCAAAGTGAIGTSCEAANGCAAGLNCIGGECQAMCCAGQDSDCPPGGRCNGRTTVDGIGFCLVPDSCDLLAQTGCGEGEGCYPLSSEGGTICGSAGTAADGAACTSANDCVAGSVCLGDNVCHSFCTPENTDECPVGSTCGGLAAFDGVGVCNVASSS